jgi:hypothetical protein
MTMTYYQVTYLIGDECFAYRFDCNGGDEAAVEFAKGIGFDRLLFYYECKPEAAKELKRLRILSKSGAEIIPRDLIRFSLVEYFPKEP